MGNGDCTAAGMGWEQKEPRRDLKHERVGVDDINEMNTPQSACQRER